MGMDKHKSQSDNSFENKSTENCVDFVCKNPLKNHFEKKYGHELTDVELADCKNKLTRFFSLLIEIDQKNKGKEAMNDDSQRNSDK